MPPHVQMMDRNERETPDPANTNPPDTDGTLGIGKPATAPEDVLSTARAKRRVTEETTVRITCDHHENQVILRKLVEVS